MWEKRHRPLYAMSTGEARKTMVIDCLLSPPRLVVLDEAFDGLDAQSRDELRDVLLQTLAEDAGNGGALALIAHHLDDLVPAPTHALLLGRGATGVEYCVGDWSSMEGTVAAFFESQRLQEASSRRARPATNEGGGQEQTERARAPPAEQHGTALPVIVDFREVTIRYSSTVVFEGLNWTVPSP